MVVLLEGSRISSLSPFSDFLVCFGTLPQICVSRQSCLSLVFALTCTVKCGTLYRQGSAFLKNNFHQLNLPQVDSNQVEETSQG